jgi:NADH-ubiquinone oxidoreductase chain 2
MSLGGLPPFTGFLAKLMAVQTVINRIRIIIVATLVFSSLVSLFYYMRVAYSLLLNTTKRSIVVKTQTSSLSPVVTTTVVAGNVIAPLLVLLV